MKESDKTALNAAKVLQENCKKFLPDCEDCIFNKHDPEEWFFKGCFLSDCNLPETWELEKIGGSTDG